jgi:hypothetical protein
VNDPVRPPGVSGDEGKPPFFRTWRGLYIAVLVNLAVLILAFTLFTRHFR